MRFLYAFLSTYTCGVSETIPQELSTIIEAYRPVAENCGLQEARYAAGSCWFASAGFMMVAQRAGFAAEWIEFYIHSHPLYARHSGTGGFEIHAVTIVPIDGVEWLVDFSAAQFDMNDTFPLVRRFEADDELQVSDHGTEPIDCNGDWIDDNFTLEPDRVLVS